MKNFNNLPQKSGIYLIKNLLNNKVYIGQSKNIFERIRYGHMIEYKNPNNACYNTKFYQALRKYGLDNFEVSILELCPIEQLNIKEVYYIGKYNSFENGYNSTIGGQNLSINLFIQETEEKRKKTREKNQSLKSQNHPRAKLTNEQVINIRKRYIQGETMENIYKDFQNLYSNKDTFKRIVLGYTYKDVGNKPTSEQIRHTNSKLTDNQIREIRKLYKENNISYAKIGKMYGVSGSAIRHIIIGKTYKHVLD